MSSPYQPSPFHPIPTPAPPVSTTGDNFSSDRQQLVASPYTTFVLWEYNSKADAVLPGEQPLVDVPLLGDASQHAWLTPLFRKAGYNLVMVETLPQMLALLREQRYPVVISDMTPGNDWRDLLRELQPEPEAPYAIVLIEQVSASVWADVLVSGGFDVLARSAEPELLLRSVNIACQRWHTTALRQALRRTSSLPRENTPYA